MGDAEFPFLLTIAVPTYNRQASLSLCLNLLARALESVSHPIEVIVLDNASTDRTLEVIKSFSENLHLPFEFVIIQNDSNIGLHDNLFKGMRSAQGRYFMWIGDDDTLNKEEFRKLVAVLDSDGDLPAVFQATWPSWNVSQKTLANDQVAAAMELFYFAGNSWATVLSTAALRELLSDKSLMSRLESNCWRQTYLIYAIVLRSLPRRPFLFELVYGRQIEWQNPSSKTYFIRSVSDLLDVSRLLSEDFEVPIRAFHGRHTSSAIRRQILSIAKYAAADIDRAAVAPVFAAAASAKYRLRLDFLLILVLARFPRILRKGVMFFAFLRQGPEGVRRIEQKFGRGQSEPKNPEQAK